MFFFKSYPNLTVIVSCLFWGTYWIPLRSIDSVSSGSVWPLFLSFLLLALILVKPLIKSITNIFINKNYFFLSGCFFAALGIALYSESLLRGEIAKVVVLFYLCPIWGTIFARFILNHSFTIKRIFSIILGIIGLEIIVGFEKGIILPSTTVEWIALLAGLMWAMSMTLFNLANTTSGVEKTSLTAFLIPFVYLFLCFIPGGRNLAIPYSLLSIHPIYIWMILFAIIWLLPSILLTYFSVEVLDPGRINILLAFEVAVGFLSSALLTSEIIGFREYIGAIFVVSACFVDVSSWKKFNAYFSK
jgi:drug/metabolite transporter (DMT)-like permease